MKNNPNHGNRLRPPDKAYEVKKKRAKNRYASEQLKLNPLWLHNKILRDLVNLFGIDKEITYQEFINRGFNFKKYKSISKVNGHTAHMYDKYGIYILPNKNLKICINNN